MLEIFPPKEYGEMYQYEQVNEITISSAGVAYTITGMTSGLNQDVTFQNGSELLILVSGTYLINFNMCFTDGVNTLYQTSISVNDTIQNNMTACNKKTNANDIMRATGSGLVMLNENDIVKLIVINTANTTNIIVSYASVNLLRYN